MRVTGTDLAVRHSKNLLNWRLISFSPQNVSLLKRPNKSSPLRPTNRHLHTSPHKHIDKYGPKTQTDYLPQARALMFRMAEMQAELRAAHPEPISSRTPNFLSAHSNLADKIERGLHADGHRLWGFVIYRCTYASDADWEICIQRIHTSIQQSMRFYNGLDLLEEGCFKLTVIEDAKEFDGASTAKVRRHFHDWCAGAVYEEQGSREEIERRRREPLSWCGCLSVRYRYCVQIDTASLQSILSGENGAWVNLIRDDWQVKEAMRLEKERESDGGERVEDIGVFTDEELADMVEEYPAIEGCTEEDVGWMMVEYESGLLASYDWLRDPNGWTVTYCRPPYVVPA